MGTVNNSFDIYLSQRGKLDKSDKGCVGRGQAKSNSSEAKNESWIKG